MSHRSARPAAVALVLSLVFQGPAPSLLALSAPSVPSAARDSVASAAMSASAAQVLNRLSYGPRPGDISRVAGIGVQTWIEQQLHPERIDDAALQARLATFETLALDSATIFREYHEPAMIERRRLQRGGAGSDSPSSGSTRARGPSVSSAPSAASSMSSVSSVDSSVSAGRAATPSALRDRQILMELEQARLLRAVYSERQLEEVLVDFWFNHFNVFAGKGPTRAYVTSFERDAIRPHALGNFRQMLEAAAASPAMLFYLDNWMNTDPQAPQMGTGESQGRSRLGNRRPMGQAGAGGSRAGGPPQRQAPARGINENYARELLELHTLGVDGGYTQDDIVNVARAFTGWTFRPRQGTTFTFARARHDDEEKTVLGHRIKAGGGMEDGRQVLDILAAHPSTARFIATKLAQKFVADTPPAALVERAARRFIATRGDLREVTRAIVTSPEFFAAGAYRAKVKTPLEFVASAIRATAAEVRTAMPLARTLRDLGMPLYSCQPPTGYDETAETWVSSGALVARMNFALELGANRLRGVSMASESTSDRDALRARIVDDILGGDVSAATRSVITRATTAEQVVALAIGSPEFQRQ